jgi:regulator of RNase E activity RraA
MAGIREKLQQVSTATVTTVLFKRGFRNTFMQGPRSVRADALHMVGEAYTLRFIPAREDLDTFEVFKNPAHPQRKAIESVPAGQVLVIDSRGDARAATAGGILVARLKARGAAGIVSDGGFRDAAEIAALDFPSYHSRPSAPANVLLHHAVESQVPIGCGGVAVYPGDWILGDGDGVVVIPAHVAAEVASEALEQTIFEDFATEEVHAGKSIVGLYPPTHEATLTAFAEWRKRTGR